MGNIIRRLMERCQWGQAPQLDDVYIDFVDSKPTEEDQEVYNRAEEFLKEAVNVLTTLTNYKGSNNTMIYLIF